MIRADIEEVLTTLTANVEAMAATLKLRAERANVLSCLVEHENRRMVLQVELALLNDVEQPLAIKCHVVRRLPRVLARQLRPLVNHLVLIIARAEDHLAIGLLGRGNRRRGKRHGRNPDGGFDKLSTRRRG